MNYFTVYKITNNINNKIYVGVHKTTNVYDEYYGSGVAIKRAIEKYGKENFTKETLYIYDNEQEMYQKEKEIVNEDFINDRNTYNMTTGGVGSWAHVDSTGANNCMHNPEVAKKVGASLSEWIRNNPEKHAEKCRLGGLSHIGRNDSEEVKRRRAESVSKACRNADKKYKLVSPDNVEYFYATIAECVEYHDLNRNLINRWIDTGVITKSKNATRVSESAKNTYGWSIEKIK